ncbi:MAG TPA: hypothetical protein VMS76_15880 [Planctomycetota bacterium]|nr:hypothetical protein [Planctomycetota bacterium]
MDGHPHEWRYPSLHVLAIVSKVLAALAALAFFIGLVNWIDDRQGGQQVVGSFVLAFMLWAWGSVVELFLSIEAESRSTAGHLRAILEELRSQAPARAAWSEDERRKAFEGFKQRVSEIQDGKQA